MVEMIIVTYIPSGESSPLPNGKTECRFDDFQTFKEWVQGYVCIHCLVDFYDFNEKIPVTLSDWLDMGCGCEIFIEDDSDMIDWDSKMVLPENFAQELAKYD